MPFAPNLLLNSRSVILALCASIAIAACTTSGVDRGAPARGATWVGTWGASETAPAPNAQGYKDQTLRLIVHTTLGGDQVRIRISNAFGTKPLTIGAASIGLQSSGAAVTAGSSRPLLFAGRTAVTIPPAALILSDPLDFSVPAQANLAISLFLPGETGGTTLHPLATQTSYVSGEGNFASKEE